MFETAVAAEIPAVKRMSQSVSDTGTAGGTLTLVAHPPVIGICLRQRRSMVLSASEE
jgi:hypothetical protein